MLNFINKANSWIEYKAQLVNWIRKLTKLKNYLGKYTHSGTTSKIKLKETDLKNHKAKYKNKKRKVDVHRYKQMIKTTQNYPTNNRLKMMR